MQNDTGCACRHWSLADVDIAEETAVVTARRQDTAEYCGVVTRWNARVATAPPDTQFSFFDYCAFLLEAYDALDAVPTGEGVS